MTEPGSDAAAQLQEYQTQLTDVIELLKASPEDDSLLSLKNDLEELISITRSSTSEPADNRDAPIPLEQTKDESSSTPADNEIPFAQAPLPPPPSEGTNDTASTTTAAGTDAAATQSTKKKKLKVKDFEVPEHLIPLDSDTEAEKNKKRRAIKALKNKWREKKKAAESTKKQQSWQSFQSKTKKKRKDKSIFATQDGVNAKVGVISAGSMTNFGERKRHKHA
mmetsp:Transcript_18289/g.25775  ORF Transcript_18289/g.25775 Transcript_18289/m.25775 type:complete len:222 (+) Transcript_18289:61-726(+)